MALVVDWSADRLRQPFCEVPCVGGVEVTEHDDELVAAEPSHRIVLPNMHPKPLSDLDQDGVPGVVPVCVVDLLEVIDVTEEDNHRNAAAEHGVKASTQLRAVRQPGQRIVRRSMGELELSGPPVAHVVHMDEL